MITPKDINTVLIQAMKNRIQWMQAQSDQLEWLFITESDENEKLNHLYHWQENERDIAEGEALLAQTKYQHSL